jgi:hypothetical protein
MRFGRNSKSSLTFVGEWKWESIISALKAMKMTPPRGAPVTGQAQNSCLFDSNLRAHDGTHRIDCIVAVACQIVEKLSEFDSGISFAANKMRHLGRTHRRHETGC